MNDIRSLYGLKNKKCINDKVLRDTRTLHESHKEDYYKRKRIGNAFSSNCNEYERNRDKDKTLSTKDYVDEIRPYINNLIDNHKTQRDRLYDTKLKVRGLECKRASDSELKTELGLWGAHEKFSVEKASRLASKSMIFVKFGSI